MHEYEKDEDVSTLIKGGDMTYQQALGMSGVATLPGSHSTPFAPQVLNSQQQRSSINSSLESQGNDGEIQISVQGPSDGVNSQEFIDDHLQKSAVQTLLPTLYRDSQQSNELQNARIGQDQIFVKKSSRYGNNTDDIESGSKLVTLFPDQSRLLLG